MKSLALTLTSLLLPATVHAASNLSCSGEYVWAGEGLSDVFQLTAQLDDALTLSEVREFRDEEGYKSEFSYPLLSADLNYKPHASRYRGFNRFRLASATSWTNYLLLLPKDIGPKTPVTAYIQRVGFETYPTVELSCEIR